MNHINPARARFHSYLEKLPAEMRAPRAEGFAAEAGPFEDSTERSTAPSRGEHRYRAIWLSDIHLGTRGCKAEFLLDFLRHNESQYLYLVGDIVDGWRLKRSWFWAQSHNDVIQKLLRKARKGTAVYYIPGNHDEWLRDYVELQLGGVWLVDEIVHVTADGKRLLVTHGDAFDGIVRYARWIALLGDWAYARILQLNHYYNVVRRRRGYPYWSLSAYLKHKVKNAVQYISDFADAICAEAKRRGVDGVVCGHIHHAEIRTIDGILYCNDGDWVESCTALVEHFDGRLEIVRWAHHRAFDMLGPAAAASRETLAVSPAGGE